MCFQFSFEYSIFVGGHIKKVNSSLKNIRTPKRFSVF